MDGRDDGAEDGLLVGIAESVGTKDGQFVGKALGSFEGELVGTKVCKLAVGEGPSGFTNFEEAFDPKKIVDTKTASIVPSVKAAAIPHNATISHLLFIIASF